MRMNYISKIQSNIKYKKRLHTNKVTSRIIDGTYKSIYKGRSMEFDELREYVPNDDIKDVDWKASSRSRKLLIRQYIAEKKHNVMVVFDAGKKMLGETPMGEEKREVALMAAGTLAYLVSTNGDYVSATYSVNDKIKHFPFRTGFASLENILVNYHKDVTLKNNAGINNSLEYIIKHFKRRMIVVIVTDTEGILSVDDSLLKRVMILHDVLFMNIADGSVAGKHVYDIAGEDYLPEFFTSDKKLARLDARNRERANKACYEKLKRLSIAVETIDEIADVDVHITTLFNRHKGERGN